MKALLGAAIALNYLENITYLILFICYIKPLVTNPRQIDVISNVVVLIIAFLTNFRFGLIAFSRMFPKPNIYVQNPSKLTPIHYLCIVCLFLDVLSLAACGLGIFNSQKLSNTFMLSIDLLIVIIINFAITIWFVAGSKPEEYYDDFVKKYHI
jgi:ABC-type transport system involved in multi-copper enzyme maturation permease subunit